MLRTPHCFLKTCISPWQSASGRALHGEPGAVQRTKLIMSILPKQCRSFMEWGRDRKFETTISLFSYGSVIPQLAAASGMQGDGKRFGQVLVTGASNFGSQNEIVSWHQLKMFQLQEAGCRTLCWDDCILQCPI